MRFQTHQSVLIRSGKHAGIVGTIEALADSRAAVRIEGCISGEPVNVRPWINLSALEVQHG